MQHAIAWCFVQTAWKSCMACTTQLCILTTNAFKIKGMCFVHIGCAQLGCHQQHSSLLYSTVCVRTLAQQSGRCVASTCRAAGRQAKKCVYHGISEPSRGVETSLVSATYLSGYYCRDPATAATGGLPTALATYLHQAQGMRFSYIMSYTCKVQWASSSLRATASNSIINQQLQASQWEWKRPQHAVSRHSPLMLLSPKVRRFNDVMPDQEGAKLPARHALSLLEKTHNSRCKCPTKRSHRLSMQQCCPI